MFGARGEGGVGGKWGGLEGLGGGNRWGGESAGGVIM